MFYKELNGNGKRKSYLVAAVMILLSCAVLGQAGGIRANAEEAAGSMEQQTVEASVNRMRMIAEPADALSLTIKELGESVAEAASDPYRDRPEIDPDDWRYILANPWNEIGEYTPVLVSLEGQQFDERIVDDMQEFAQAARDEGLSVFLSSGYRSYGTQSYLYRRKVDEYGEAVAQTIVARPGTSEHQTGLCCDITDRYYEMKDASLENTELYQWMSEHCGEYGFIVRFPKGKEEVTGIIYEPWHFRYVGEEAATYIMEHDLTLEEFLELYE